MSLEKFYLVTSFNLYLSHSFFMLHVDQENEKNAKTCLASHLDCGSFALHRSDLWQQWTR